MWWGKVLSVYVGGQCIFLHPKRLYYRVRLISRNGRTWEKKSMKKYHKPECVWQALALD